MERFISCFYFNICMKKRYLLLVLVLLIVSGCEEGKFSPKKNEISDFPELVLTDEPIQGKSDYVTYNLPDGVYHDKDGNTIFYISDEPQEVVDLSSGYIIEFDDFSVIEKKIDLQKEGFSERQISKEAAKYRSQVLEAHNNFISLVEQSLDRSLEGRIRREFTDVFNGVSLDIPYEDARKIEKLDGVKRVVNNEIVESFLMDSVPLIYADLTWDLGYTGEGVKVAVIDTGIDYTHPDLGGCFGPGCKVEGGYDAVNLDDDPMDDHFHGTHCAGIVASEDGNGVGLLGVAPEATLYSYKVLDSGGSGYWDWVIYGIERAVQDEVDVISMSLGCTGYQCNPNDPVSTAVDNAMDSGVVVVVAAGNSGSDYGTIGSPGTARKVISVGASYKKNYFEQYWNDYEPLEDQVTSFSSRGPVIGENYGLVKPDVVAPGAIICSSRYDSVFPYGEHDYYHPCVDESHVQLAGTSMATPMTAGLVALLLQAHPDWTPMEVKMALRNNAFDLFDSFGYDINTQGYGRIDALQTVQSHRPPVAHVGTSGKIAGLDIQIDGTAISSDFLDYRLFYSYGYVYDVVGAEWVEICYDNNPVDYEELCDWDTRGLNDGEYTLKLVVNGNDEQSIDYAYVNKRNVEITEPFDLNDASMGGLYGPLPDVLPTWENILIEGTTMMDNFDHYEIEWMKEEDDYVWSSEGVILANGGLQQVIEGELGEFDVFNIVEAGFYHLKLTVFDINQNSDYHEIIVYIDPSLHVGWPRNTWEGADTFALAFLDQPSFADLDGDGKKEIITAYEQTLSVLDDTGVPLPGWPKEIETWYNPQQKARMQTGPAVADIDGDGELEIVVGDNAGHLHVLNHDGTYVFEPEDIGGYLNTPTIADINDDGELEIIVGDWWSQLHVLNSEGNYLPGWPKYLDVPEGYHYFDGIWTSPSVSDLNEDGKNDIIVYSSGCNVAGECSLEDRADRLWVLDYNGNNLVGWPRDLFGEDVILDTNIVLADLDKDGMDEIVVGSFFGKPRIYDREGNVLDGWPVFTGSFEYVEGKFIFEDFFPSVGDINGDGLLEIFGVGYDSDPSSSRNCIYSFDIGGNTLDGFPVCIDYEEIYTSFFGQQIIGDIDGDGKKEVNPQHGGGRYWVYGLFRHYALDEDGTVVGSFPKVVDDGGFGNVAPMSDIDGDGLNEMLIGTWAGTTFVWDLEGYEELNEWPVYQHDSQHTGNYNFGRNISTCFNPTNGMEVYEDITFCPGTYSMPDGIIIENNNLEITCDDTIFDGEGIRNNYGVEIQGVSDIIIRDCEFKDYDWGAYIYNSEDLELINNKFKNIPFGIEASNSENLDISDNIFSNNDQGINLYNNNGVILRDNRISSSNMDVNCIPSDQNIGDFGGNICQEENCDNFECHTKPGEELPDISKGEFRKSQPSFWQRILDFFIK